MSVKHTLIPSRGKAHIFKGDEVIVMKRGSYVAGRIKLSPSGKTTCVAFEDENGNKLNQTFIEATITSESIRSIWWSRTYGYALYLEEKLCPNGAKAIPEKDDTPEDQPGKYIIWCPTSNLPPRVVLEGEKQARAVAHSMAERHGGEFFWCRLNGKVTRKAVTTYENVVTRL